MGENAKTDEELAAEVRSGSEEALEELLGRFLKSIYNFIYRFTQNREDTEDIIQETFLKVWKNISSYKREYIFKQWLFTIARNATIDFLRKRKNLVFSDFENREGENTLVDNLRDLGPLPDEIVAQAKDTEILEAALLKLSPIYKEVLLLRYNENFTFEEIAKILDKPLDTVKSQYRRGILSLRDMLLDAPKENPKS